MQDKKLTENFKLSEFTKNELSPYQEALVTILARNLQTVRNILSGFAVPGKKLYIRVTSGVRTMDDYNRLVAKGYNPSKTSDHFCGLQLNGKPTLGAADIQVVNCSKSCREIAAYIIEMERGAEKFGQVIYERNPATGAEWIHLGNNWNDLFCKEVAAAIGATRKRYLMSLDNGKTYVPFTAK